MDGSMTDGAAAVTAAAAAEFMVGAEGADKLAAAATELGQHAAATLVRFAQGQAGRRGFMLRSAAATVPVTCKRGASVQEAQAADPVASSDLSSAKRARPDRSGSQRHEVLSRGVSILSILTGTCREAS